MTQSITRPRLSKIGASLVGSAAVDAKRKADRLAASGKTIVDLGFGEPDGDAPRIVKQATIAALEAGHSHYVDPAGLEGLRERIAAYEKGRHGVPFGADGVVVTTGTLGALTLAFRALLDPGDEAIVMEPFWGPYAGMIGLCGATSVSVPAQKSADGLLVPNVQAIKAKISPKTRLVVINSPNNPSGYVWSRAELEQLGEICLENDLWLVSDEVYAALVYDGVRHRSVAGLSPEIAERTIVVSSLSKAFAMTGWRLGYCLSTPATAKVLARINHFTVRCATSFAQYGAITAFDNEQALLDEMIALYSGRRDLVASLLQRLGSVTYNRPDGTFYAFVRLPDHLDDTEFVSRLLEEEGVIMGAGSRYGQSAKGFVRLSFAAADDQITAGLERFGQLVERLAR